MADNLRCDFRGQGRLCGYDLGHEGSHRWGHLHLYEDPQDGTSDDLRRIEEDRRPTRTLGDSMRGTLGPQLVAHITHHAANIRAGAGSSSQAVAQDVLASVSTWLAVRARYLEGKKLPLRHHFGRMLAVQGLRQVARDLEREREEMARHGEEGKWRG